MVAKSAYENGNFIVEEDEYGSLIISAKKQNNGLFCGLLNGERILALQVLGGVAVCIRLRTDVQLNGTQDDSLLKVAEK